MFLANDRPAIRKALLRLRYLDKFAEEARARRTNLERQGMSLLEIHEPGETPLPHAGEGTLAVGIDLGTTNSVVAIAREGKPAALHDETGKALVPSVVAYPAAGGVLVGDEARLLMAQEPKNVVASVKRLMGRGAADLHAVAGVLPYEIEPGTGQTDMVKLRIGGKARSPVEISAEILKALRTRAEAALEKPVERAVITVPAYFDDAARTATRDAARVAGLEVLRLVNEPTAAALAYGLDKGSEGLYAVYDLGGGTFDFSLLRLEKGVFQVLATGGDTALGGDDFDRAIAERMLAERKTDGLADTVDEGAVKNALGARAAHEGAALRPRPDVGPARARRRAVVPCPDARRVRRDDRDLHRAHARHRPQRAGRCRHDRRRDPGRGAGRRLDPRAAGAQRGRRA